MKAISAVALAVVLSSGCTNNRLGSLGISSGQVGDPLEGVITGGGEASLTLTRVIKNSTNPTSTFDLIGDGTGTMGAACVGSGTSNTSEGPSTCSCSYSYRKADGSTENFEVPTTHHESNLIRCLYTGIPVAVTSVEVRVHITTSDTYSNAITYRFSGTGVTLDTSLASTYSLVQRYQCRPIVTVSNPFLDLMYDPFQSEDPKNTFPINFYTTNMGASLAAYAGGVDGASAPVSWDCPAFPNDSDAGMELNIFSIAADSSGSKKIYPATGSVFDRSTFHVAKQATGIFNVPINAYIAPEIVSSAPDSQGNQTGPAPLGYGAAPIPTGVQGQETCPDSSVQIPSGYHWVKVWLFRMALPQMNALRSPAFEQLGGVGCSPGKWTYAPIPAAPADSVYEDCSHSGGREDNTLNRSHHIIDLYARPNSLVSRFFEGTNMCVNLDPILSGNVYGPGKTASSTYATGTDIWLPNDKDDEWGCSGSKKLDPAHVCSSTTTQPAYDASPVLNPFSTPAQYDFIFVVSPPSVMSGDMSNTSSTVHNTYTPYRFMSSGDCNSPDPDNPLSVGDCSSSKALRNYGIKFHDVGLAGDPPADDPSRPGIFPVCALQPD